jgi:hypothetical protein
MQFISQESVKKINKDMNLILFEQWRFNFGQSHASFYEFCINKVKVFMSVLTMF